MKSFVPVLVLPIILGVAAPSFACTIPVFRYALEKWDLTPYEVLVYYDSELPGDVQTELAKWDVPNRANIEFTHLDIRGKLTKDQAKLLAKFGKGEKLPWMLVRSRSPDAPELAWSGACTVANLHALLDSPMRRTLLGHLTRGDSAVYILLKSGNEKADQDAQSMASTQLKLLEKAIPLPEQKDDGPKLRLPIPLKMSLPLLVLDRKNADEAALIRMLLTVEEDLDKVTGPMLFAIYGKGRVLPPLYNHGEVENLNPKMLKHATEFLCGPCSCEVKDRVPGTDLLMSANWNEIFDRMFEAPEPVTTPPVETPKTQNPISVPVTPVQETSIGNGAPEPSEGMRNWLWIGIAATSGLVLLTGGWVVYAFTKEPRTSEPRP